MKEKLGKEITEKENLKLKIILTKTKKHFFVFVSSFGHFCSNESECLNEQKSPNKHSMRFTIILSKTLNVSPSVQHFVTIKE